MATNVRNVLLEVVGKSDEAQRSLQSVAESVRSLPDHATIEVQAQVDKARSDLKAMVATLKAVDRTTVEPEVRVAITKAITKLEAFDERLDSVDDRRVTAHLEVEVQRDDLRRALAQAQTLLGAATAKNQTITLDIEARTTSAEAHIASLEAALAALPDTVSIEFDARRGDLQRALADARGEVERIGRSTGIRTLDAQIDEASAKLATAQRRLVAFRQTAGAAISPKLQEFEAAVNVAAAKIEKLTARRHEVALKLNADTTAAEANVARLEAELAALPEQQTIELALRDQQLRVELAAAAAEVDALTARQRDVDLKFNAETLKAEANIARLAAAAAALPDHKDINIGVNRSILADLTAVDNGISGVVKKLDSAIPAVQRFGAEMANATFRASVGFLSFGGSLGPIFAIVVALAITVGTSLVAALGALVASAAAAAAGIGVLGVALVGALGPAAGLAAVVGSRLGKVTEALKAQDAEAQSIGTKTAAGAAAAAAGIERQQAAARALQTANEQLGRATAAAYREMEDAAEAASDAVRGITDANLSLDEASLSIREAESALADFTGALGDAGVLSEQFQKFTDVAFDFDATALSQVAAGSGVTGDDELKLERLILNVRRARQQEKNATDAVSDAERNRSRTLAVHNSFVAKGIAASEGYQAALRGVQSAQEQANKAASDPAPLAATEKAAFLVGQLTDRERELLAAIKAVRTELRGAFRGATDAVFGGMIQALRRVPRLVNPLRGAFAQLGRDIAAALDVFSGELIRPEWISAIRQFIAAGGRIARVFTRGILVPFLRIVRDLALAALPRLENGLRAAGRSLTRLAAETGPEKLSSFVNFVVDQLKSWLALAFQLGRVFIGFIRGAAGEGSSLVDQLTDGARSLGDFLNSARGRNQLAEFFKRVIPQAKEFLRNVGLLTVAVLKFVNDTSPLLTGMFKILGTIVGLLQKAKLLQSPLATISDALTSGSVSAAEQSKRAIERLQRAEENLHDAQVNARQAQRDLTQARRDARRELSDLASAASGAQLDKRHAALDLRSARAELSSIKRRSHTSDELERARLNVADAEQRVRDATREATRATVDNQAAQRGGIKGTDTYRAALQRQQDTQQKIIDALAKLSSAQAQAAHPPQPDLSPWDRIKGAAGDAAGFVGGAFSSAWSALGSAANTALSSVSTQIRLRFGAIPSLLIRFGPQMYRAASTFIGNVAAGISARSQQIRTSIGQAINGAITRVRDFFSQAKTVGSDLGQRIADGISAGLSGIANLGRTIINGLIDLFNDGLDLINKATPGALKIKGRTIIPSIPDIPPIPHLAGGGITTGPTSAIIGDNPGGREAVLPLTNRVLRQLAQAIMGQLTNFQMAPALASGRGALSPAAATAGAAGGYHVGELHVPLTVPGGGLPDAQTTATALHRLLERRAGGSPRQD